MTFRVRLLPTILIGVLVFASSSPAGIDDSFDWKGKKRTLKLFYDFKTKEVKLGNQLLSDVVNDAIKNWNAAKADTGWEFTTGGTEANHDIRIKSGALNDAGGASTSGFPAKKAKAREVTELTITFDPAYKVGWGANDQKKKNAVGNAMHELSHTIRLDHQGGLRSATKKIKDPQGDEPKDDDITKVSDDDKKESKKAAAAAIKVAAAAAAPGTAVVLAVSGFPLELPVAVATPNATLSMPGSTFVNNVSVTFSRTSLRSMPEPFSTTGGTERMVKGVHIDVTSQSGSSPVLSNSLVTLEIPYGDGSEGAGSLIDIADPEYARVVESSLRPFVFDPLSQIWKELDVAGLGGSYTLDTSHDVAEMTFPASLLTSVHDPEDPGTATLFISLAGKSLATCTFDTNGDGVAELNLNDADGNGFCEWPKGRRMLHGTLTFTASTPVEFRGVTSITANQIVIEEGAQLVGQRSTLKRLTLATLGGGAAIRSHGVLDIAARDDLVLAAAGSIDLAGPTKLEAGDRLLLRAARGDVTVAPPAFSAESFTLFGRNRVDIQARAANASVDIARARIGSFRIVIVTRSYLSQAGQKQLVVRDHAVLTTDRAATGLPDASNILLDATGPIVVTGDVLLDAGTNLVLRTQRSGDDVCLSQNSTLEAQNGLGRIFLGGVRGRVFDDGTTIFRGLILGGPIVAGTCEAPSTTTSTSPTPSTTTATSPGGTTTTTVPGEDLALAQWNFYVRIARTDGSETNVTVPKRTTDEPVDAEIRADHLSAFNLGDQVTHAEIEALGGDTLARLTDAAHTFIAGHPTDYPDFARVVTVNWAKRVAAWFKDAVDAGDDPTKPGCHYRYPNALCAAADQVFFAGDACNAPPPNNLDLFEWTDQTCHQHSPTEDLMHYGCDLLLRCPAGKVGRCVVDANACGVGKHSAHCACV